VTDDRVINDWMNRSSHKTKDDKSILKSANVVALQQVIDQLDVFYLAAVPGN